MMTGRERVKATLTFSNPDRAPRDLWTLPYILLFRLDELDAVQEAYPLDFVHINRSPERVAKYKQNAAKVGTYTDDWGSVWRVAEVGVSGEVRHPVLADWSDLATFQPPWHLVRKQDTAVIDSMCAATNKFTLSDRTVRPFEQMQFLRGTEALYVDIGYGTAELRALLEMVHQFFLEDVARWCETAVDGIGIQDDWGSNQNLLINPRTWRELFKPLYEEYCQMIHAAGKFVFFHSDGHISAIFGDLIKIGVDAINAQLFVMDIEDLARQYKGKVSFWGEIDRQHVLAFGTAEDVREAVMRVRRALDDGSGGVIAQCAWGKDNPKENIETVYRSWSEPILDESS